MRHTFASMHYAYYGDKKQVVNELGHCNESMLRYYINHGAKMKKRAKGFFAFKFNESTQNHPILSQGEIRLKM